MLFSRSFSQKKSAWSMAFIVSGFLIEHYFTHYLVNFRKELLIFSRKVLNNAAVEWLWKVGFHPWSCYGWNPFHAPALKPKTAGVCR